MARKLEPIIHKCHAYPKKLKKVERQGFLSSAAYKVQAYNYETVGIMGSRCMTVTDISNHQYILQLQ